jgi:hypothetical protein
MKQKNNYPVTRRTKKRKYKNPFSKAVKSGTLMYSITSLFYFIALSLGAYALWTWWNQPEAGELVFDDVTDSINYDNLSISRNQAKSKAANYWDALRFYDDSKKNDGLYIPLLKPNYKNMSPEDSVYTVDDYKLIYKYFGYKKGTFINPNDGYWGSVTIAWTEGMTMSTATNIFLDSYPSERDMLSWILGQSMGVS